ncbi:MAG: Adenosylcobinamide-phosphate guanylyltransferase [Acidobacteriaceae bacterium]|jgi:adenosylcobinamide kinase/adenosylcobinamide-phosphate guanylyltransferase|nr:Adenosylcobinamide-phosphate guanylyltransferase [Acidobacteriaceae bacterium]
MQEAHRKTLTLVLGGVRSGKSRYAQRLGLRFAPVTFIATARVCDDEMRVKVERHRNERPKEWDTVEEPLELAPVLAHHGPTNQLLLIDCLTLFASNLLEADGENSGSIHSRIEALCQGLISVPCSVVLVSNEVGSGVVPAYFAGRRFRDLLGEINQRIASLADNVVFMVAGLPLALKGKAEVQS